MRISISAAVLTSLFANGIFMQSLSNTTSPCAQVAQSVNGGAVSVPAALANACLLSIPFNQSAAARFLRTLSPTFLDFQTTTAYLKNPPASYQQPAVDLNRTLLALDDGVSNNKYTSQYSFEKDVANMLQSTHDGHVNGLFGTVGNVFRFSNPLIVVSVSEDGQQLPQLFALYDLNATLYNNQLSWQPSALQTVNGEDAVSYTKQFATNYAQANGLELNVDWNTFMFNPARFVAQYLDLRGYGTRIYTQESLNVTFANGTQTSFPFEAFVQPENAKALAKVTSGQDFYDSFVLPPESQPGSSPSPACPNSSVPVVSGGLSRWPLPAYPEPLVVQTGLGVNDPSSNFNGYATGYVIKEKSLAILSIPNFGMSGGYGLSFSEMVGNFTAAAKAAGATKLLLDLQGNSGGSTLDSVDTFKHLFPQVEPFAGSRLRSNPVANTLGTLYSEQFKQAVQQNNSCLVDAASTIPWVAQSWDNAATGQPFASWQEMGKPYADNGDFFLQTQLFNLSNPVQDIVSTGYVIYDYADRVNASAQQPFAPEDVAILTDGICASTCTLLFEFLHHQMGIRSIAAGGLPQTGPMQANGGVRGALDYSSSALATDISLALQKAPNNASKASLPSSTDFGIQFSGTVNLRDQVRANETFPLQFAYEAADCRIFYTRETFNNFTALWMYAAEAAWGDGSLCVPGSTGHPSASGNVTWNCAVDAAECAGPGAAEIGQGSGNGNGTGAGAGAPVAISAAASNGIWSGVGVVAVGWCVSTALLLLNVVAL